MSSKFVEGTTVSISLNTNSMKHREFPTLDNQICRARLVLETVKRKRKEDPREIWEAVPFIVPTDNYIYLAVKTTRIILITY
jgi:hypothetical protein